jgi:p-hydroxybenzoate 3-monooxygenase
VIRRTRVGIIGAGPAGMLVATILQRAGIDCVVVERRDRAYVEQRARGGTIEYRVVELLRRHGLAGNLLATGAVEDRIEFRMGGRRYPISYEPLAAGRTHYIYPQQFLVRDLIEIFLAAGGELRFDTPARAVTGIDGARPRILLGPADEAGTDPGGGPGTAAELECEVVVACDGEYGVGRRSLPADVLTTYEHRYDYAWLAVLAQAPPSSDCVINAVHEAGSCVHVRRTPEISRFYLQCPVTDTPADWPADRIWKEVRRRLTIDEAWELHEGPILQTGTVRMRSLVCAPMQYGSLFLAGDAAHVVPPVGGKGLNIALADAEELALALIERFRGDGGRRLDGYTAHRLPRIWRIQEFVHWMMDLVNTPGLGTATAPFLHRIQRARLERLMASPAYTAAFLEDYIGWE